MDQIGLDDVDLCQVEFLGQVENLTGFFQTLTLDDRGRATLALEDDPQRSVFRFFDAITAQNARALKVKRRPERFTFRLETDSLRWNYQFCLLIGVSHRGRHVTVAFDPVPVEKP